MIEDFHMNYQSTVFLTNDLFDDCDHNAILYIVVSIYNLVDTALSCYVYQTVIGAIVSIVDSDINYFIIVRHLMGCSSPYTSQVNILQLYDQRESEDFCTID